MLTKIKLFYQIRKFYNIFGDEVGNNFITKLSDITYDNLGDVLFDLNEIYSSYWRDDTPMSKWLCKIQAQIYKYRERPQHNYTVAITIILVALALIGGYTIGRYHTIHQAELLDIAQQEYHIGFGDEVHIYTFEEVR